MNCKFALIAFCLARKYGIPLIEKFVSMEKITQIENKVPEKNVFWSIVFLRMVLPVDVLSYALGLFSKISKKKYVLATLIGISPFAFAFAYLGRLPIYYQIAAFSTGILIFLSGWLIANKRS